MAKARVKAAAKNGAKNAADNNKQIGRAHV